MDLAKIRKKSLQTLSESVDERHSAPTEVSLLSKNGSEERQVVPAINHSELTQSEQASASVISSILSGAPVAKNDGNERSSVTCTPLEAILSGRNAAGCNDESVLADDTADQVITESVLEFLCFRVSDEVYGVNIMDIKEIIKPREVTEVPRAPVFVSGVLSLRGTIIPIIDMRVRLGLAYEVPTGKERIIVIKNSGSFSGLLVDEVIQVVQIQIDAVEAAPTVLDGIDRDFISGIGRSDGRLIIILNLENVANINLY
jgi:purine-binding chemotaxis protein CheW